MPNQEFEQLQLFQNLTPRDRSIVQPLFTSCEFQAGKIIFEQGDITDFLYLVLEGEVVIRFKPDDGPALVVARVKPQGIVGWSAALGSPTYTSTAECSLDCKMMRVRGTDLRNLCESYPDTGTIVLEHLATVIAERLRNTHDHVIHLLKQGMQVHPTFSIPHI